MTAVGPGAGIEIEVKLGVTEPTSVRRLLERPDPAALAGFEATTALSEQVVVDRYIDTADGRLQLAGARARVRTGDATPILTLKHHGLEEAGVTARHEVEGPADAGLDPRAWPDSVARRELLELTAGAPVVEIARLRQRRHVRLVRRDATTVELSLDELEALDGDRVSATRWELEAELKAGDRAALAALAAALAMIPGVRPASGSKLGFALAARRAAPGTDRP